MRPAERAQSIVAWDYHALRLRARPARIAGDDFTNNSPVNLRLRHGQFRRKTSMIEKLPRRAHHDETTMVIGRRRIGFVSGHRPGHRIKMVLPHQFVRKRKSVAFKLESVDGVLGRRRYFIRTLTVNAWKSETGSAFPMLQAIQSRNRKALFGIPLI